MAPEYIVPRAQVALPAALQVTPNDSPEPNAPQQQTPLRSQVGASAASLELSVLPPGPSLSPLLSHAAQRATMAATNARNANRIS